MPYIEADEIMAARQIDLLTYLQQYEPNELVKLDGGNLLHQRTRQLENQ